MHLNKERQKLWVRLGRKHAALQNTIQQPFPSLWSHFEQITWKVCKSCLSSITWCYQLLEEEGVPSLPSLSTSFIWLLFWTALLNQGLFSTGSHNTSNLRSITNSNKIASGRSCQEKEALSILRAGRYHQHERLVKYEFEKANEASSWSLITLSKIEN